MNMDKICACFPPVTSKSIFQHYLPGFGAVSHAAFAVHVINPTILNRVTREHDLLLGNALFVGANVGVGLYVYHRAHMKKVSVSARVIYSVYGSLMFNFGSALFWALTKLILPDNIVIRSVFGILTSVTLLSVAKEYLGYIDTVLPDD